jgi:hypothetical protein
LFEAIDVLRVNTEQLAPDVECAEKVVKWCRFGSIGKFREAGNHLVEQRRGILGLDDRARG